MDLFGQIESLDRQSGRYKGLRHGKGIQNLDARSSTVANWADIDGGRVEVWAYIVDPTRNHEPFVSSHHPRYFGWRLEPHEDRPPTGIIRHEHRPNLVEEVPDGFPIGIHAQRSREDEIPCLFATGGPGLEELDVNPVFDNARPRLRSNGPQPGAVQLRNGEVHLRRATHPPLDGRELGRFPAEIQSSQCACLALRPPRRSMRLHSIVVHPYGHVT